MSDPQIAGLPPPQSFQAPTIPTPITGTDLKCVRRQDITSDGRITISDEITNTKTHEKKVFTHTWTLKLGLEKIEKQARAVEISKAAQEIIDKTFGIDEMYAQECFQNKTTITSPPPYWINISFPETGEPFITKINKRTETEDIIAVGAFTKKKDIEEIKKQAQQYFNCRKDLRNISGGATDAVKLEALKQLARKEDFQGIYQSGAEGALEAVGDEFERLEKVPAKAKITSRASTKQLTAIQNYAKKVQETVQKRGVKLATQPPLASPLAMKQVQVIDMPYWEALLEGKPLPNVPADFNEAKQFHSNLVHLREKLKRPSELWRDKGVDENKRKECLNSVNKKIQEVEQKHRLLARTFTDITKGSQAKPLPVPTSQPPKLPPKLIFPQHVVKHEPKTAAPFVSVALCTKPALDAESFKKLPAGLDTLQSESAQPSEAQPEADSPAAINAFCQPNKYVGVLNLGQKLAFLNEAQQILAALDLQENPQQLQELVKQKWQTICGVTYPKYPMVTEQDVTTFCDSYKPPLTAEKSEQFVVEAGLLRQCLDTETQQELITKLSNKWDEVRDASSDDLATSQAAPTAPVTVPSVDEIPPPPEISQEHSDAVIAFKMQYANMHLGALADLNSNARKDFEQAFEALKVTLGEDLGAFENELNRLHKELVQPAPALAAQPKPSISLASAALIVKPQISVNNIPEKAKGITNAGNTCYLASTLQALRNCKEFRKFLSDASPKRNEEEFNAAAAELARCNKGISDINNYVPEGDLKTGYNIYQVAYTQWGDIYTLAQQKAEQTYHDAKEKLDQKYQNVLEAVSKAESSVPQQLLSPGIAAQKRQYDFELATLQQTFDTSISTAKQAYQDAIVALQEQNKDLLNKIKQARQAHKRGDAIAKQMQDYENSIALQKPTLAAGIKTCLLRLIQYIEHPTKPPYPAENTGHIRDYLIAAGCAFPRGEESDANDAFNEIMKVIGLEGAKYQEEYTYQGVSIGAQEFGEAAKSSPSIRLLKMNKTLTSLNQYLVPTQSRPIKQDEVNELYMQVAIKQSQDNTFQMLIPKPRDTVEIKTAYAFDKDHPPKLLQLNLQRMTEYGLRDASKVKIPEIITISGVTFRLKAAVIHTGGLTIHGGHYLTISPSWGDKEIAHWMCYNDASAKQIDMKAESGYECKKQANLTLHSKTYHELLDHNAYCLYYEPEPVLKDESVHPQPLQSAADADVQKLQQAYDEKLEKYNTADKERAEAEKAYNAKKQLQTFRTLPSAKSSAEEALKPLSEKLNKAQTNVHQASFELNTAKEALTKAKQEKAGSDNLKGSEK